MKRGDIEKVAKDYAQQKYCSEDNDTPRYMIAQIHAGRDGFIEGANWRINSVWHDSEDIPHDWNKDFLVEVNAGGSSFFMLSQYYHYGGFNCMDGINNDNITVKRWAYLKDLIPNNE